MTSEFQCEQGLVECRNETLHLTALGHRIASKLLADGTTGTVLLKQAEIEGRNWAEMKLESIAG